MQQEIQYTDWNLIDYKDAWDKQKILFDKLIEQKSHFEDTQREFVQQWFIVCEHPHVYTLGKNGQANNMLIDNDFLQKINASYYHIDRGGDITYHGQGQIVGYPILDLEAFHLSLKQYIFNIEELVIRTLGEYGITAERLQGATGVWIDSDKGTARKICAIGVHASRYVTTHGFALNVNTDLRYYDYINPCGFTNKGVTSMEKELGHKVNMEEVKERLRAQFAKLITHN